MRARRAVTLIIDCYHDKACYTRSDATPPCAAPSDDDDTIASTYDYDTPPLRAAYRHISGYVTPMLMTGDREHMMMKDVVTRHITPLIKMPLLMPLIWRTRERARGVQRGARVR